MIDVRTGWVTDISIEVLFWGSIRSSAYAGEWLSKEMIPSVFFYSIEKGCVCVECDDMNEDFMTLWGDSSLFCLEQSKVSTSEVSMGL